MAPRLWISRNPEQVRASPLRAFFGVPVVKDFAYALKHWEEKIKRLKKSYMLWLAKLERS